MIQIRFWSVIIVSDEFLMKNKRYDLFGDKGVTIMHQWGAQSSIVNQIIS